MFKIPFTTLLFPLGKMNQRALNFPEKEKLKEKNELFPIA